MKYISLFFSIFLVFLFVQPAHAATWASLSTGDAQSLRAMTQSGDVLVAVGNSGAIVRSTDQGKTWEKVFETTNVTFFDVSTFTDGRLIAIGSGGINMVSDDQGKTWSQFSFGNTGSLHKIEVNYQPTGTTTGFLVGQSGLFKYYANNNWHTQSLNTTVDLFDVAEVAGAQGFIVGVNGTIIKFLNGGLSYAVITSNTYETLRSIHFVSATKGFIVGTMGTILKTTDGGSTWSLLQIAGVTNQLLYDVTSVGDRVAIAGKGVLISSSDAGESWSVQPFADSTDVFYGVHATSADNFYAIGSHDDVSSLIYHVSFAAPPQVEVPAEPEAPVVVVNQDVLVKLACSASAGVNDPCRAVYVKGKDGVRHAFTNDKVFFSWFSDFSTVKEISASELSAMPLGKNVTYKPGVKMVKFQTSPQVYAVSKGGVLRAISSEVVAGALYGTAWNKHIDDISDVFYKNYTFGTSVTSASDFSVQTEIADATEVRDNF